MTRLVPHGPTPLTDSEILGIDHISEYLAYQPTAERGETWNGASGLLAILRRHHPELSPEAFTARMKAKGK